jgi:hypothetical protein
VNWPPSSSRETCADAKSGDPNASHERIGGPIRSIPIESADRHRRASHFLPNFFHKLNGAFHAVQQRQFLRARRHANRSARFAERILQVPKVHILSMFLASLCESCNAHSTIGACKFFSSFSAVVDAQDVVSSARQHAPSCENALIFFLLV